MAKTLAILASLLFLIISVICVPAKERVPSLEIIQREDAEEGIGFPVEESLVCMDPKGLDNKVTILSGEPPHMGSRVQVTCETGMHFIGSDKTSVKVRCDPLPHPCMCMAAWQTTDDYQLMYNLNCTSERVQNEITTTHEQYEERSGRSFPEINQYENENSNTDIDSESETKEFIPEDSENTIFEYNVNEAGDDETASIELPEQLDLTNSEIEGNNIEEEKIEEEELPTKEEETEENEPEIAEYEYPYQGDEEEIPGEGTFDEENNVNINEFENGLNEDSMYKEEETEEGNNRILEEQIENEEQEEEEEGEYHSMEESNTEENEEEFIEESNAEEQNGDGTVKETFEVDNEEEALNGENEEEIVEGDDIEETHKGEQDQESSDVEIDAGEEDRNEDETSYEESYERAWFEEGLNIDEDEEEEEVLTLVEGGPQLKRPGLIYNAIAELTKYDEEDDNKEVFDDSVSQMVEPPEDFNTVQTYPVRASDEPIITDEDAICSLPAVSGPCKAYFRRYFFNSKTGECDLFIYGGCDGNGNNFETLNDCQTKCVRRDNL